MMKICERKQLEMALSQFQQMNLEKDQMNICRSGRNELLHDRSLSISILKL